MACFLGPIATRAPGSDVFSRSECDRDPVEHGPSQHLTSRGPGRNRTEKTRHFEGSGSQSDRENTSLRGVRVAIGPGKHVTSRGPDRNRTEKTRHFEGTGSQSDRENTSLPGAQVAIGPRKHVTLRGPGRTRTEKTRHFEEDPGDSKGGTTGFARKVHTRIVGVLFFNMKSIPSNSESPPGEPGVVPGGSWGAIGPRKHVTSRGPGRSRTEKTRHFEGSGSQSDRGNTSLRGVRVAIGPRKHVTSNGLGRNRTEKTRHFEGS